MRKLLLVLLLSSSTLFALSNSETAVLNTATPAIQCSHTTGECPGVGWFCLNGECVQEHTGVQCWNDIECPIGGHCIDGVCK